MKSQNHNQTSITSRLESKYESSRRRRLASRDKRSLYDSIRQIDSKRERQRKKQKEEQASKKVVDNIIRYNSIILTIAIRGQRGYYKNRDSILYRIYNKNKQRGLIDISLQEGFIYKQFCPSEDRKNIYRNVYSLEQVTLRVLASQLAKYTRFTTSSN